MSKQAEKSLIKLKQALHYVYIQKQNFKLLQCCLKEVEFCLNPSYSLIMSSHLNGPTLQMYPLYYLAFYIKKTGKQTCTEGGISPG